MNPYATHQPILLEVLKLTNGPVLEIGAGDYSTSLIHENCKKLIITIDDNPEWLSKYEYLKGPLHRFKLFSKENFKKFFDIDHINYGLVFIDASNWDERNYAVMAYRDTADYLVIHDSENRNLDCRFKYAIEFTPIDGGPSTLIGSNIHETNDINIEGFNKTVF
jgi:hypothetical protein